MALATPGSLELQLESFKFSAAGQSLKGAPEAAEADPKIKIQASGDDHKKKISQDGNFTSGTVVFRPQSDDGMHFSLLNSCASFWDS